MLTVGSTAPDFTLRDQNRQPVTLSDYRAGEDARNVLLVFFPLAFTGICEGELGQLRDHLPDFENDDSAALAISVGPPPTHKIWTTQSGFLFPVLSAALHTKVFWIIAIAPFAGLVALLAIRWEPSGYDVDAEDFAVTATPAR